MSQLRGKSERLEKIKVDKGYKAGFVERVEDKYGWKVEVVQKLESAKGFVPAGGR